MNRNKLHLYIHLVWGTRDRLPLITPDVERKLYRYISGVCRHNNCPVLAIGGMHNHIHLLIALPTTMTLADLMHQIKGGSSRYISQQFGTQFEWQTAFGAFSVSQSHKERVRAYILRQKQHHADYDLWTDVESIPDEETDDLPQTMKE